MLINKNAVKDIFRGHLTLERAVSILFSSYIVACIIILASEGALITDISPLERVHSFFLPLYILPVAAVIFALCRARPSLPNLHKLIMLTAASCYALIVCMKNIEVSIRAAQFTDIAGADILRMDRVYFTVAVLAVLAVIIQYTCRDLSFDGRFTQILTYKRLLIILGVLSVIYTIFIGTLTVYRLRSFHSSTYDFGLFAQMFEYMADTGWPFTTLERNIPLSHFAVHFSPIFYVFLPGYMLFRSPEYLLYAQALVISTAVIPLALICKKLMIPAPAALFLSLAYLFYPSAASGAFFDFHENKILTLLLLWLFYFIIDNKIVPVLIFTYLTLSVKEDAPLYIFVIAIYLIVSKRNPKLGVSLFGIALVYFIAVITFLNTHGQGVMLWRYDEYLLPGQDSFIDIALNVLKNPVMLIRSLLTPPKLIFLLYMLLPLAFLPFVSRSIKSVILLLPMVIMNLSTSYVYQFNINFQYTYGVAAFLFFAAAENFAAIAKKYHVRIAAICLSCAVLLFIAENTGHFHIYRVYHATRESTTQLTEAIAEIPRDARVTASTFITPHLFDRREVFDLDDPYGTGGGLFGADYVIIDIRFPTERFARQLYEEGYILVFENNIAEIYRRE